jgi:AcrR family transcriptional regulator
MCPAIARTNDAAIVEAVRALLESGGPEAVTMQAVGAAVGVRGPSLYKRFADRAALLRAVEDAALVDLTARLQAVSDGAPRVALNRMAETYRAFAKASPAVYGLLFAPGEWDAARVEARARAAAPLLAVTHRLIGGSGALPAARLLTALLHGWVSMEFSGAFRLGGNLEAAFAYAVGAAIEGITSGRAPLRL